MQWEHKKLLKHIQNFTNIYEVEGVPKSQLETLEKMLPELSTKKNSVPSLNRWIQIINFKYRYSDTQWRHCGGDVIKLMLCHNNR